MAFERFPERITLQMPPLANAALKLLARRDHRTVAEMARQAVLQMLEANGLSLGPLDAIDAPHAGAPAMPHAGAVGTTVDIDGDPTHG